MHGHSLVGSSLGFITEIAVHLEKLFSTITLRQERMMITFTLCIQQLLDHKSYYLNITDANLTNKPKWQLEYTVKVGGDTWRLLPSCPKLVSKVGTKMIYVIIAIKIVHPGTDF